MTRAGGPDNARESAAGLGPRPGGDSVTGGSEQRAVTQPGEREYSSELQVDTGSDI